jgi:hypothetical protein
MLTQKQVFRVLYVAGYCLGLWGSIIPVFILLQTFVEKAPVALRSCCANITETCSEQTCESVAAVAENVLLNGGLNARALLLASNVFLIMIWALYVWKLVMDERSNVYWHEVVRSVVFTVTVGMQIIGLAATVLIRESFGSLAMCEGRIDGFWYRAIASPTAIVFTALNTLMCLFLLTIKNPTQGKTKNESIDKLQLLKTTANDDQDDVIVETSS